MKEDIIIYAEKSMGNGKIENISDVVYVSLDNFDKIRTKEMVVEIEKMNRKLMEENRLYSYWSGPMGNHGSLYWNSGNWSQISAAKVIVETSLADFPLDASLGSHFFHNVTSMNMGYLSIQHTSLKEFIDWNYLEGQELIEETHFLRHVRFSNPVCVVMDGRKRISAIYKDACGQIPKE